MQQNIEIIEETPYSFTRHIPAGNLGKLHGHTIIYIPQITPAQYYIYIPQITPTQKVVILNYKKYAEDDCAQFLPYMVRSSF